MDFNNVQISKVDNGYVVSTTKFIFGDPKPESQVNVFREFSDVLEFITPQYAKIKLSTVKEEKPTSTIAV